MSAATHFAPLSLCVLTVSDTRTADNDTPGAKILSTSDFASHVAEHAAANLGR